MTDGNPYAPPRAPIEARASTVPGVWTGYVTYCVAMTLLYLAVVVGGVALLVWLPEGEMGRGEALVIGLLLIGLGLLLAVAYGLAPLLPKTPGTWVFGLVLIGFGLTSCLTLPFAIPLMLYWIKPETQRYFGRAAIIR